MPFRKRMQPWKKLKAREMRKNPTKAEAYCPPHYDLAINKLFKEKK